jgi:hypothetical protein
MSLRGSLYQVKLQSKCFVYVRICEIKDCLMVDLAINILRLNLF